MIDPGHPFSVPYGDVIAAVEERIRDGTEQPGAHRFVFQGAVTAYELPREASGVTTVSGFAGGVYGVFERGEDYAFTNNRVIWVAGGRRPDELSRVDVEFTYRERPSGLTDFNEGSVIGTLVRAVAREMKVIYEQMDEAYRRAFIDVATGVALDNVVALLGIARNPAIAARGQVTFLRRTATDKPVPIARGTRVADAAGRTFATLDPAAIADEQDELHTQAAGIVHTTDKIAKLVGVWVRADAPDPAKALATSDTLPRQPFGEDERTITLAAAAPPAGELLVRYQAKSVTVPVEATEPGPGSNVDAATVTVMPTPPAGVTGVTNEAPIEGGRSAEPDDQLRERAKHALERAGNATLNALRFGVLDVDGVEEVEVVDHAADPSLPLGDVRLRYSASGDLVKVEHEVLQAVNATRAAGIRVVAAITETVLISGTFYVVPDVGAPTGAEQRFLEAVIAAIGDQRIGAPLSPRRLSALAFQVGGLADVAQVDLKANGGAVPEPLVLSRAQLARPDTANLHAVLLEAVHATRQTGTKTVLEVQLVDGAGAPMTVVDTYELDVDAELGAVLLTAPDQPPQRIGSLRRRLSFAGGPTATLTIPTSDVPGFRPADHDPTIAVTIAAAPYSGLTPAHATLDFS